MKIQSAFNLSFYRRKILLAVCAILVTACGTATLNTGAQPGYFISGKTKSAGFKLERVRLAFASGLPDRTVQQGQAVQPRAVIEFRGSGVLRAKWLLDDRVLEQLNIPLNHGSQLELTLKNPLSTRHLTAGQHQIRLLISQPGSGFKQPQLKFFITP